MSKSYVITQERRGEVPRYLHHYGVTLCGPALTLNPAEAMHFTKRAAAGRYLTTKRLHVKGWRVIPAPPQEQE